MPKKSMTQENITRVLEHYYAFVTRKKEPSTWTYLRKKNFYASAHDARSRKYLHYINLLYLTNPEAIRDLSKVSADKVARSNIVLEIFHEIQTVEYKQLKEKIVASLDAYIEERFGQRDASTKEAVKKFIQARVFDPGMGNQFYPVYCNISESIKSEGLSEYLDSFDIAKITGFVFDAQKQYSDLHNSLKNIKKSTNNFLDVLGGHQRLSKKGIMDFASEGKSYNTLKYTDIENDYINPKKNRIKIKNRIKKIAQVVASFVGFGEGTVAAVSVYAFMIVVFGLAPHAALAIAAITLVCGAILNYILVRNDTENVLTEFFQKKCIATMNGPKKYIAVGFSLSAIATGCVYGLLSASKSFSCLFVPILRGLMFSASAAAVIAAALTAGPVICTTIGMASILFYVIFDFIKNNRWVDISNYILSTYIYRGWKSMDAAQMQHAIQTVIFEFGKVLLGLGLNAVITTASFHVFLGQGTTLLSNFINHSIASRLALALSGINAVIATSFGIKKISILIDRFCDMIKNLFKQADGQTVTRKTDLARSVMLAGGLFAIAFNCGGQGMLMSHGNGALVPIFGDVGSKVAAGGGEFVYSTGANSDAYFGYVNTLFKIRPMGPTSRVRFYGTEDHEFFKSVLTKAA